MNNELMAMNDCKCLAHVSLSLLSTLLNAEIKREDKESSQDEQG
jgi:hypothetical protein